MTSLVLLPGLACDAELWAAQIDGLAGVAAAQVGDTLRDDGLPAMAERVLAAAPERFALAGLSMGGYLCFEILRRAPGRVVKLALIDTSARPDTPEQAETRRDAIASSERHFAALMRTGLAKLVVPGAPAAVRETVVEMALRVGAETYRRQQRAITARPDSRSLLPRIAMPTLVLVGEQDALTPPAIAGEMARDIPGAELAVVPGSGHLSPLERPEAVTGALRRWLAR